MKSLSISFLALLFIASIATTGCSQKKEQSVEPIPAPPVEVVKLDAPVAPKTENIKEEALAPTAITWVSPKQDFGKVAIKEELKHTFTFTNTGDAPLKLLNVKPSCSCTASEYTREMIAPGEQGKVVATFTPKAAGNFTKTITVTTNTAERNTVLTLTGEGGA